MWEPPSWDAFSKVNIKNIDPSEYEDENDKPPELVGTEEESTALVKAKPQTINGWDPETKTQKILTDEDMQSTHHPSAQPACTHTDTRPPLPWRGRPPPTFAP